MTFVIRQGRNRDTGTLTSAIDNREQQYVDDEMPWYTECADHSTNCGHYSRRVAESMAAHPGEWCELCWMIYDARRRNQEDDELPRDPRARLAAMLARYADPHGWDERTLEFAREDVARMSDEEVHTKVGASVLGLDRD